MLFDPTFLLLLPAMGFAMWAQHKVKSTYEQFSTVPAANGLTGREMAGTIMRRTGVSDVGIEAVNHAFGTSLPEGDFDTIGGLVAHEAGRVPRRGEAVSCGGLKFSVMLTRGGAVRWFRVERLPADAGDDGA